MPAKMSRSAPRPPFRLREVSIAVRTLRLSCRKAGKAPIFTPVRESSGESRFNRLARILITWPWAIGLELWKADAESPQSRGEIDFG